MRPAAARRAWLALLLGFCVLPAIPARAEDRRQWPAGPYSFSDELGGFLIRGVTGTGTRDDPIVVHEELESATPVTLTIRAIRPIRPFDSSGEYVSGILYMRVLALNDSGQPWVEFEFELQEILGRPSTFGDGLSFDQRSKIPEHIASPDFATFSREFAPYARLLLKAPDVVVLDLNLPDMSGTDILARLKSDSSPLRRTPVVVLTTTDDKVEIQRCYDLGCNVYITKPVNYENFAEAIRQLGLFLSVIQVPNPDLA